MGKASIIILYGTSTAGKTTICKELQRQDASKPHSERLHWVIDGQDFSLERMIKAASDFCIDEIKKRKESQLILQEVQKVFSVIEIGVAIYHGKIVIDDVELSFLKDENIDTFKAKLDEFYDKLSPKNQHKINKQAIENLRLLAIAHSDVFANYHIPTSRERDIQMFNQAIENSKNGIPTVIDIVPDSEVSLIDEFFNHLKSADYSCPVHVALVHCPLNTLTDRMIERNRQAIERGEPNDIRNQTFPFHQYAQIFSSSKDESARTAGKVKKEDIIKAVTKFGKPIVQPNSPNEAEELMDKLGFPKEGHEDEIRITARVYFDRMYNTEAQTSTEETAKKLTALATTKSEVPSRPHPVAEAFKRDREKIKLKSVEAPKNKSNETENLSKKNRPQ